MSVHPTGHSKILIDGVVAAATKSSSFQALHDEKFRSALLLRTTFDHLGAF